MAASAITCPVHLGKVRSLVITSCGHGFDQDSMISCFAKRLFSCPICREPITSFFHFRAMSLFVNSKNQPASASELDDKQKEASVVDSLPCFPFSHGLFSVEKVFSTKHEEEGLPNAQHIHFETKIVGVKSLVLVARKYSSYELTFHLHQGFEIARFLAYVGKKKMDYSLTRCADDAGYILTLFGSSAIKFLNELLKCCKLTNQEVFKGAFYELEIVETVEQSIDALRTGCGHFDQESESETISNCSTCGYFGPVVKISKVFERLGTFFCGETVKALRLTEVKEPLVLPKEDVEFNEAKYQRELDQLNERCSRERSVVNRVPVLEPDSVRRARMIAAALNNVIVRFGSFESISDQELNTLIQQVTVSG